MQQKQLLPYISNKDLYLHTEKVVVALKSRMHEADAKLHKNVVDPFSAVFSCSVRGITLAQWLELEKARQVQKTLEDLLGYFHEGILSSIPGWQQATDVVDLINSKLKIVADIKNKFNTTKGSDKKTIYDNLEYMIGRKGYEGFKGYYVEIIPRKPEPYDRPFTPPDNVKHTRRAKNENIRMTDGSSFYDLASGYKGALKMLYEALPIVIGHIIDNKNMGSENSQLEGLFERAYGKGDRRV